MKLAIRVAVAACVSVATLGLVGTTPAMAAGVPTHRQVVSALLTADKLPDAWHKVTYSDGSGVKVTGCSGGRSRGVAEEASRSFQFATQPVFLDETVQSYRTLRAARLDVRRGVVALANCDSLVVDGHPWTVQRLRMYTIGDQQALFELKGFVTTTAGDVPVTSWVGVSRVGHHVASTVLTVGGPVADEDVATFRDAARNVLGKSQIRVTNKLGV